MTLTSKQRKLVYLVMFLINSALVELVKENLVQQSNAHLVALASAMLAMFMKEVSAKDGAAPVQLSDGGK